MAGGTFSSISRGFSPSNLLNHCIIRDNSCSACHLSPSSPLAPLLFQARASASSYKFSQNPLPSHEEYIGTSFSVLTDHGSGTVDGSPTKLCEPHR